MSWAQGLSHSGQLEKVIILLRGSNALIHSFRGASFSNLRPIMRFKDVVWLSILLYLYEQYILGHSIKY